MDNQDVVNNEEPKVAPAISKISLDELKEIKKSIGPVRSKSEEEMLALNPDIDPSTVYSEPKKSEEKPQVSEAPVSNTSNSENEENKVSEVSVPENPKAEEGEEKPQKQEASPEAKKLKFRFSFVEPNDETGVVSSNKTEDTSRQEVKPEIKEEHVSQTHSSSGMIEVHEEHVRDDTLSNDISQEKPVEQATEKPVEEAKGEAVEEKTEVKPVQSISPETQSATPQAKTSKIDLSELRAAMAQIQRDESGNVIRDNPPVVSEPVEAPQEQNNTASYPEYNTVQPDNTVREYSDADGEYNRFLDFEKYTDMPKFKLPLNWKPIIFSACGVVLAGIIALVAVLIIGNKQEPVYATSHELSIKEITGGYVGETVDLSGVYIIATYSDGRTEKIYNIKDYIKRTSKQIDSTNLKITSASTQSYIMFNVDGGKDFLLTVKTLDKSPTKIEEVKLTKYEFLQGAQLSYEDMIVKVETGEYGTKLLTVDEIKNNLVIKYRENPCVKLDGGFQMRVENFQEGTKLTFAYTELGKTVEYEFVVSVVGEKITLIQGASRII